MRELRATSRSTTSWRSARSSRRSTRGSRRRRSGGSGGQSRAPRGDGGRRGRGARGADALAPSRGDGGSVDADHSQGHVAAQEDGPHGHHALVPAKPAPDPAGLGPGSTPRDPRTPRTRSTTRSGARPRARGPRRRCPSLRARRIHDRPWTPSWARASAVRRRDLPWARRTSSDGAESPFRFGVEIEDVVEFGGRAGEAQRGWSSTPGRSGRSACRHFQRRGPVGGRRTLGLFLHGRPARDGAHARARGQAQASGSRSRDGAGAGRDDLGGPRASAAPGTPPTCSAT